MEGNIRQTNCEIDDYLLDRFLNSCRKTCAGGYLVKPDTQGIILLEDQPGQPKKLPTPSGINLHEIKEKLSLANITRQDLAEAYDRFPFYFNLFFDSNLVAMLDLSSRDDLFVLAVQCSLNPESISEVQFRIGFGIHDGDDHSIRLPAYIYPIVEIINQLCSFYKTKKIALKESCLPSVVLYSAAQSVARTNNLNPQATIRNRDYHFSVLQRYIRNLLPEEARKIFSFKEDQEELNKDLMRRVEDFSCRLLATHADHPTVKQVTKTALRHGSSPEKGIAYGVLHSVYSRDDGVFAMDSCLKDDLVKPTVIMMGGAAEVDYWRLRRLVQKESGGSLHGVRRIQVIQTTGIEPPYHRPATEDISSACALQLNESDLDDRIKKTKRNLRVDFHKLNQSGLLNPDGLKNLFAA